MSALMMVFLLVSCGGDAGDPDAGPSHTPGPAVMAWGKAHLEAPIVGARVELQDEQGKPLPGHATAVTGSMGVYNLAVQTRYLPRFKVVVSGGTHEGKPFTDTLTLEVVDFDADRDLLYVNGVTTLIARYMKLNPGTSLAAASSRILDFLQIPQSRRATVALANPHQNHFSHRMLLEAVEASSHGALGSYLDALAQEAQAGDATHHFAHMRLGDAAGLIEGFAESIVDHLADEAFGWVFESILTSLGIGGNAEILNELHEISAKLDEISADLQKVLAAIERSDLYNLSNAVAAHIAVIQSNQDRMITHTQSAMQLPKCGDKPDPACAQQWKELQAQVDKDIEFILNPDGGVTTAVHAIKNAMLPGGTHPVGLLGLWANAYGIPGDHFDVALVNPKMDAVKRFYQSALVLGSNMVVEAQMTQKPLNLQAVKDYANDTVAQLKLQDEKVATPLFKNPDVVRDRDTGLLWMRAPFSNLPVPTDVDYYGTYEYKARKRCETLAASHFAGFDTWRLPTEGELKSLVVKPGSPTKGTAYSGSGTFNWLIAQGFLAADDPEGRDVRGVVQGAAYFSSTAYGWEWLSHFYEALFDHGVNSACNNLGSYQCELGDRDQITTHAGAWCVAEGTVE